MMHGTCCSSQSEVANVRKRDARIHHQSDPPFRRSPRRYTRRSRKSKGQGSSFREGSATADSLRTPGSHRNEHQFTARHRATHPANPYDNASCESFLKTLKREEIYASSYENLEHLRGNIGIFIEQYYNQQRLHSALGYRSPDEFERQAQFQSEMADSKGATLTFFASSSQSSTGLLGEGDSSGVHP